MGDTMRAKIMEIVDLSGWEEMINDLFESVKEFIVFLLVKLLELLMFIARPLYISLIAIGVMLYVISPTYRHMRYIYGGIILAIFAEVVLPYMVNTLLSA